MAIIRSKKLNNFTVLDNGIFDSGVLSFEARGLLSTLLSKPDNWTVHVNALIKETDGTRKKSGRDAVYAILNELVDSGYVVRKKHTSGKIDYHVFDSPVKSDITENPDTEKACYGKSVLREIPITENPDTDYPDALISTERQQELKKEKQELNLSQSFALAANDADLPVVVDKKTTKASDAKENNKRTWDAYSNAYFDRYGVWPLQNGKVNTQIANIVKSVGAEQAPALAVYFVSHNDRFFVQRNHDIGLLLSNLQKVMTDMQTGKQMTSQKAKQIEQTQANAESHKGALALLQAKGLA